MKLDGFEIITAAQKEYAVFLKMCEMGTEEQKEFFKSLKTSKYLKAYLLARIFSDCHPKDKFSRRLDGFDVINKNYIEILQKTKKLAQELNLKNSLEIANLYTYLLWNGYFSRNKSLVYKSDDRLMVDGYYSLDIMNGYGVCLNFSDMLTDLINQCDYSAAILINKLGKPKREYMPKIERPMTKSKKNVQDIFVAPIVTSVIGNHAFTLIKEQKGMYIYDATNLMALNIKNKFKAKNICGTGTCYTKPMLSKLLNNPGKSEEALAELNLTTSFESPYGKQDFISTWEKCYELFETQSPLLDDFHSDINDNIEQINYKTNILRKK